MMSSYQPINDPHSLILAITLDDYVIGEISIVANHAKSVEIGYVIAKKYWNQGLVSEATQAFCQFIFTHFEIETIYACFEECNIASQRVLEKCHFTYSHQANKKRKFDSSIADTKLCLYYMLKNDNK